MNSSAVLFDMDGVTIDTEPLYTRAEIRLFREYGIEIPEKDFSLFRGCSEDVFFDLSMDRYGISENRAIFINKGRKYVLEEFKKNMSFISGFKKLHCWVSKFYHTGLVTASPKASLDWIRKKMHLEHYFKYMLSGEETVKNKPHPHPYLEMMRRIGVAPDNTIIIEDSISGICSALDSKAHVIARCGSVSKERLHGAHRIIDDYSQITPIFLEELLQEIL